MFDIGFQELILILVVALLVFGPRRLPELGRALGRAMREFRRATEEFRSTVETNLHINEPDPIPPPPRSPTRDRRRTGRGARRRRGSPTWPSAARGSFTPGAAGGRGESRSRSGCTSSWFRRPRSRASRPARCATPGSPSKFFCLTY